MLLYAKSLSGDLHTLSICWEDGQHICPLISSTLSALVCPDDPSRLRLVSAASQADVSGWEPVDEKALDDLLDEVIAEECGFLELDADAAPDALERREWRDGDVVMYWVDDPIPLSVSMMDLYWAHYTLEDERMERPMYPCIVSVSQDIGQKKNVVVYTWQFIFDLRSGKYYEPRDAWMERDDVYPHVVIQGKGHDSLESMLRDADIPERYRRLMLRACRRKWVRILRRMSQASKVERELAVTHVTELFVGEKAMFREHWWYVKTTGQRPVL